MTKRLCEKKTRQTAHMLLFDIMRFLVIWCAYTEGSLSPGLGLAYGVDQIVISTKNRIYTFVNSIRIWKQIMGLV